MAYYKLGDGGVSIPSLKMFIPEPGTYTDPETNQTYTNSTGHWTDYQAWLADGNVPDPQYTLEEYRVVKRDEVQGDARNVGRNGVDALGATWDSTFEHLQLYNALLANANTSGATHVRMQSQDSAIHNLTVADATIVVNAVQAGYSELTEHTYQIVDTVNAATSIEELEAITWTPPV